MKDVEIDALTVDELRQLREAFDAGVKQFDAAVPAFEVEVKFAKGMSKVTFNERGEMLLDGKLVGETKREEVLKQLGLTHTNRGHGALRDTRVIANEAVLNAADGAGMSGQFASDEAMLRSVQAVKAEMARVETAKGTFTMSKSSRVIELPTTPNTGRSFVANGKLPTGVTPVNAAPFPGLPVSELPVTHVRAYLDEVKPGQWEITTIYPTYKPPAPVAPVPAAPTP
jgi:hypothetical protein